LLVQVSKTECLYSDSERFVPLEQAAGVDVELEVYPDMWHDWQLMAPLVYESRQAMASAAAFLRRHLQA
jgi:acetyl esterase/lipase